MIEQAVQSTSSREVEPPLLSPRYPLAFVGLGAAVFAGALRVLTVLFIAPIFDTALIAKDVSALPRTLLLAGVIAFLGAVMLFVQDICMGTVAARVVAQWREGLLSRLLERSPGALPGSSGGLTSRIVADLKEVELYYTILGTLVAESSFLICILATLFWKNAFVTVILLVTILPLVLVLSWLGRRLKRATTRAQEKLEGVGSSLQEGLKHHAVIRAFAAQTFLLERFQGFNLASQREQVRRNVLWSVQVPIAQLLTFGAVALLLTLMAQSVANQSMSVGDLVSYVTLVALLSTPSQLLPKSYAVLQQARAASERLLELWELPFAPSISKKKTVTGRGLRLENVSFSYGTQDVLNNLSLTFPERGLVAFVGESGAGKSTLIALLLRFLRPTQGEIYLDTSSYANLSETTLRQRVAYVPQGTDLLSGTLQENLLLGRSIPEGTIWKALKAVRLETTMQSLGLHYELREDGVGLSGGQRQRLAVARALLSEPDVLLLDEPSANLDEESEKVLLETLRLQAKERLVIVVAHRPALIEAADSVLRLEAGVIQKEGGGRREN
ncbi:MAG: ABC transporter ATP-binding protein [Trueperaceae bacterium]